MVCGAAGLNAWKNLVSVLKKINKKKLSAVGCYQVRIWPGGKGLTKVNKKNCR
ncbi:hypothetical protein [Streptomyces sp. NPDC046939]|uniref:hypothetical protein n=1 Tax=Streptomyces sp. NPDC046939 TaxID=3155376 RepID=UPI0033D25E5C